MKLTPLSFSGNFNFKGFVQKGDCPSCRQSVEMLLVETALVPKVYHIPTAKLRSNYIAICPSCAGKFSLREKAHSSANSHADVCVEELVEFKAANHILDLSL